MNEEPTAPEESDKPDDPANKRFVSSMIKLSEMRLRDEFNSMIETAIRGLKSDLESERLEQERAESSKKLDRSIEWSKRLTAAVIGAAAMMFVMIFAEQCTSLHSRVTTLELNQAKPK
jgi:hypothetical protein